jgi:hypothetical protein
MFLKKFGADKNSAWKWANTRQGYWPIAHSQVVHTTLTNKHLKGRGLESFA